MLIGELKALGREARLAGLCEIVPGGLVVLAPHPDDESLGCGGLIAGALEAGRPVAVAVLTDGRGSHPGSAAFPPDKLAAERESEVREAVRLLGLSPEALHLFGLRDGAAPSSGPPFEALAARLSALLDMTGATTLAVTSGHDPHPDHRAAFALARRVQEERPGLALLAYPVWAYALPDDQGIDIAGSEPVRLAISRWLPAKRAAILAHRTQTSDLVADAGGRSLAPDFFARFLEPNEVFFRNL